ncbi:MAG: Smr/MutS family protein [Thermoanaerobaculaceae bacterium]|nr:Smr/MutS family protein [Thermoanaerobaculaceae bacterium]
MDGTDPPVALPVEDTLDLHAFSPRDVASLVVEYLLSARAAGLTEVRLIHGRGRGLQRASVHAVLASLPFVVAAREAPPELGGWGATVVVLDRADPADTVGSG